jgi:TRAP-type transport system periplasmic protein
MGKQPYTSAQAPVWQAMTEAITERSNGQIVIDCFHFGEHPYKPADLLNIVQDGLTQMSNLQGVDMSGVAPIMGGMELPFMFPNIDSALKVKEAYLAELANPYLEKNHGVFVLAEWLLGGGSVHGKRELNSYDACKGQKIRTFNTETANMVTIMGGSPVTVEYTEIYSALERGVVDAAMTVTYGAYDSKWYEIIDTTTLWDYFFGTDLTIINQAAFNELPANLQTVVLDTAKEYEATLQRDMNARVYWAIAMAMYNYNAKVVAMDPEFRKSVAAQLDSSVYQPWRDRAGAEGPAYFSLVERVLG